MVSYLTEELVRAGHRVTLFASGDSRTSAELVAMCERAVRLGGEATGALALHALLIEAVFARAHLFDVIHFHTDSIHLPLARRCPVPVITTLHGRLDIAGLEPLHREFAELPLVSLSSAQRAPLPWASWAGTVHHGLPVELHRRHYDAGRYLVFLGRIAREKRLDRAIARRARLPLKIAAKIDRADTEYFAAQIAPCSPPPASNTSARSMRRPRRSSSAARRHHEARYNPMAYHNGSAWPHDNALIAAGLSASPTKDLAVRILSAQLDASTYFESSRLPELFCGFRRREGKAPTSYPVACSPQAWACAAVFCMLQACLGLTIDAAAQQIAFRYPQLPPRVERVSLRNLAVGESSVDLTPYRYSGAVGLNVERSSGRLDVAMLT